MFTSSPEFAQALWNCPQMLGRVQVVITPDRYTLGEVELLTLLGTNAGRELDWDVFPETREARMIRNPKASVPWSEKLYASHTCNYAEWLLGEALFGGTYGSAQPSEWSDADEQALDDALYDEEAGMYVDEASANGWGDWAYEVELSELAV
tara:strand:- start:8476 stop:8928 length:453 start_codon:yes stop_codon:yes gene_type:complete